MHPPIKAPGAIKASSPASWEGLVGSLFPVQSFAWRREILSLHKHLKGNSAMEAFPESILFLENLCGAEIHHYIETCGVSSSEKASEALLERGIFSELMQQICSCCTVTGEAFNTS